MNRLEKFFNQALIYFGLKEERSRTLDELSLDILNPSLPELLFGANKGSYLVDLPVPVEEQTKKQNENGNR